MDDRSPVAGRLRRPGWKDPRLLIGLLLMAVAIVGVASIVRAADHTVPHYAARDTLTPGTVLEPEDLVVTHVRVGGDGYLSADAVEESQPWGQVVTRVVGAGELVPASALAGPEAFDGRPIAVISTSPVAADVQKGSVVDVWVTSAHSDSEAPQSRPIAEGLVVADVERETNAFARGGHETVYVVVPRADLEEFLSSLAIAGEVSVVGLAGGA